MKDKKNDTVSKQQDEFCMDLSEFTASVYKRFCPRCGAPVGYKGRGRPRVYCSDRCRWAANKARELKRKKLMRQLMTEWSGSVPSKAADSDQQNNKKEEVSRH